MRTCERCNGCGMVQSWYVEDCPVCGGSGEVEDLASLNESKEDECDWCGGDDHTAETCPQSIERHPVTGEL
jgi:DnaJ-class molecular chaperone